MSKSWRWQLRRFSHTACAIGDSSPNGVVVFGGFGADAASEACFIQRVNAAPSAAATPAVATSSNEDSKSAEAAATSPSTSATAVATKKTGASRGHSEPKGDLGRAAHRRARRQQNNIPAKPPADGRLPSLAKFDLATTIWTIVDTTGDAPGAREHHCAVVLKWSPDIKSQPASDHLLVIGGRTNPHNPLGDLHCLNLATNHWIRPSVDSSLLPSRYRQTVVADGHNRLICFGGRSATATHADVFVLDLAVTPLRWYTPLPLLAADAIHPPSRHSHSAFIVSNRMYVLGGCGDGLMVADNPAPHGGDLFMLDLNTWIWTLVATTGPAPPPLYSHTTTMVGDHMIVVGGSSGDARETRRVHVLNTTTMEWYVPRCALQLPHMDAAVPLADSLPLAHCMWTRHATALLPLNTNATAAAAPTATSAALETKTAAASSPATTATADASSSSAAGRGRRGRRHSVNAIADVAHLSPVAPVASPSSTRRLVVTGGGGICFSFGTFFSPTVVIDIDDVAAARVTLTIRAIAAGALTDFHMDTPDPLSPPGGAWPWSRVLPARSSAATAAAPVVAATTTPTTASSSSPTAAPAPASAAPSCSVCNTAFASRNQLYAHVKATGHVRVVTATAAAATTPAVVAPLA